MSLLDRMKGKARGKHHPDETPGAGFDELDLTLNPMEATVRLGPGTLQADAGLGRPVTDSSIISEAAPSELAGEFGETRVPSDRESISSGSGVPFIGHWPAARQQQLLLTL